MKRVALIVLLAPLALCAQELRVLSGGAAKSLLEPLAASFPHAKVEVRYQSMGPLAESLAQGAAVVAGSPHTADAIRFIEFLCGPAGQAILARYGFDPPLLSTASSVPQVNSAGP